MNVIIEKSQAVGTVFAPPSKSMAHRALICGAFSERSIIKNIAYSKDIYATLDCLEKLGAHIEKFDDYVIIGGLSLGEVEDKTELFCNESGSTLRFMIPICMLCGKSITLKGSKRLFERPLSVYESIAKDQNILFEKSYDRVVVNGCLKCGEYYIPGDISSQFITGMLYALSLLENDSKITVTGKFESASYIDLTLSAMKAFGVDIKRENNVFYIKGGQKYLPKEYAVEGDCSNAAFLEGFNLLGGSVKVCGIEKATLQGDRVYAEMYEGLKNNKKKFDLSDCPDLAPVMFAMAAYCGGAEFTGTARLKIKESDRAFAMAEELAKFGVKVDVSDDSVIVHKGTLCTPKEALKGHNDHRIVMSLALLCSVTGGEIEGCEAVQKSYPDFFEAISSLGIKVKMVETSEN